MNFLEENKRLKVDKIADGDESSVGLKGAFITETDALKSITNRIINAEENEAKTPEKKQGSNKLQALNKARVRTCVRLGSSASTSHIAQIL